jgi:mRNA-degrading endonuclease RelE of RelBE toxin-antitoxin system
MRIVLSNLENFNYNYSIKFKRKSYKLTESLDFFPEKFGYAYEFIGSKINARQVVVDKYRIIYFVNNKNVFVFSITSCLRDISAKNLI